jgi:hypothetical protein
MKSNVVTAALAAALVAGSAGALANDVVISGNARAPSASVEDKATMACFDAFIKKVLPESNVRIRVVDQSGGAQIFNNNPYGLQMDVEMTASLASTHEKLATGRCTVNSNSKVTRLSFSATNPTKLAGLTSKDIKLALVTR